MNREDCKALLGKLNKDKYFSFVVFFRSPLTDEVEERHIFSDVEWEGRIWVDVVTKIYKENNIPYAVYVRGEHVDGQGNLFY